MNPFCQIEYGSSDRADRMPCGKPAVDECADCGASICSDCRSWCCGESFCEYCYDEHVTHLCIKKMSATRSQPFGLSGALRVHLVRNARWSADSDSNPAIKTPGPARALSG